MEIFNLIPKVDQTQEFLEIANDFSNPLEIVREGISNAFDAGAKTVHIEFRTDLEFGEKQLVIGIKDDGKGMDKAGLQSFFDLGNSLNKNNADAIGEKGHGTKVYLNSSYIEVKTAKDGKYYRAFVIDPYKKLFKGEIPEITVEINDNPNFLKGTEVTIRGYNRNRREKFTHQILKDYILWFTKFGSVENMFGINKNSDTKLYLKGLNEDNFEQIKFGHIFPEGSESIDVLFAKYLVQAPYYFCKRVIKKGQLKDFPEIEFEAIFAIEGNKVKQQANPMIRRSGYQAPNGSYTVQERYGLWLCKDYIPVQRKNQWITKKGSEYTKFHAFVNCQELKLTANRGSIDNTPYEILDNIEAEVLKCYNEIISGDDWTELEWLEQESVGYKTVEKEKSEFKKRIDKIKKTKIAYYKDILLVEPQRETGVFALTIKIMMLEPDLFTFKIIDYDTHTGIDVIVKGNDKLPLTQSKLFYVEFKNILGKDFNHSFENLFSIICWDTELKHNDKIIDINQEERSLKIISPENNKDYTRYFLDHPRSAHRIEVFVLKDYLKQKLGIDFRPRNDKDLI